MSQKTHYFDFDCTSKAKAADLVGHPDFFCNFRVLTIEKIRGDLVRTLYPSGPAGWRTISRLGPNVTAAAVKEFCQVILCEECEVSKLKTNHDSYSSFKITCSMWKKADILNPDSWESGVLIRQFYTSY